MSTEINSEAPIFLLKVFGARGSMPVEGNEFSIYGGATSCFRVRAGNEEIYLDGGSGIATAKPSADARITILLTHMHLDHIIGLPFFPALSERGRALDIYADTRAGLSPQDAIDRMISPPYWPLKLGDYPSTLTMHDVPRGGFSIGDVVIDAIEGTHPSGSTIFKLTRHGKSIVYATDFEHSDAERYRALIEFAADCDLLMYDAQYTPEEYERCRGFGHSTAEVGIDIADQCGAKKILFVHHAPNRTDDQLRRLEKIFVERNPNVTFAKIGEEIFL